MKFLTQQLIEQIISKKALLKDYPKPGVIFLSLDALFNDPSTRALISQLVKGHIDPKAFDAVSGIASRGIIFADLIASHCKEKEEHFVQKVKVKGDAHYLQLDTTTEYSADALQILKGTIKAGKKYLLCDDLIATGGSVLTAIRLIRAAGGLVDRVFVMSELSEFPARERLAKEGVELISLLQFSAADLEKILLLQDSKELVVRLASSSAIKTEATLAACQDLLPIRTRVVNEEAASGINPQPMGEQETLLGAENRLAVLKAKYPGEDSILVAIENGLRYSEEKASHVDFAQLLVKTPNGSFSKRVDLCAVPQQLMDAIPADYSTTWGQIAKAQNLVQDANNPHQAECFGGVSRVEHLRKMLQEAFQRIKAEKMPDCYPKIETETLNLRRLFDLDSKKPRNSYAKRGILFSETTASSMQSRPINFYNQGVPAREWNIEPEKIARNSFKVFSTGDAFSLMSADIAIRGAHVNIHIGLTHPEYSALTLLQEGLQLCRCAYEQGAQSIRVALPEALHPILHYGDFNSLLVKLFKASGANSIYFYDNQYSGKLDAQTLDAQMPLSLRNESDLTQYSLNRQALLAYLHAQDSAELSLDAKVEQHTRQYNFEKIWSKMNPSSLASIAYLGGLASSPLIIPELKAEPHVLLCCSSNAALAEEIADSLRKQGEMVKLHYVEGRAEQAKIPENIAIAGAVVTIVQSTRPNPDNQDEVQEYQKNGASAYLFELLTVARQARLRGAKTINVINPYQFNARSDKAEDNPKGRTGAYVQQNGLLLEAAGVNHVVTAECHDNHTMSGAYTGNKIKGSAVAALSVIAAKVAQQWMESEQSIEGQLRLVTPDAGAAKRTKELSQQLQAILGKKLCQSRVLGEKQRDSHKDDSALISSMNSGELAINPKDKYLITDDETATGSTLCQAISSLKHNGAKDIAVIVVHNNMPLEWDLRQLCLARFLYLGVSDLHFSDTQEMGSLAKSYDELLTRQAQITGNSVQTIDAKCFDWFLKNVFKAEQSTEPARDAFERFKSMFAAFAEKIKLHSLANEFAHKVATKPYMGNPHAFAAKVEGYIRKIKASQVKSIVVYEGGSVAAASATALALNYPLHVLPSCESPRDRLGAQPFALIGTAGELRQRHHFPMDADGDLAIINDNSLDMLDGPSPSTEKEAAIAQHLQPLLFQIELAAREAKSPIKLLGIGTEGQLVAGQLSYLLNQRGLFVGVVAVDNRNSVHSSAVQYFGREQEIVLSADRNSLNMGDFCIAISGDCAADTKIALQKLSTEAKIRCHRIYSFANNAEQRAERISPEKQVAESKAVSVFSVFKRQPEETSPKQWFRASL